MVPHSSFISPALLISILGAALTPPSTAAAGDRADDLGKIAPSSPIEEDTDLWNVTLRPYLWAASLKGDVGAQGLVAPVDFSFGDVVDSLDAAFALYADINRGKWTLALDFQYLKLSSGIDDFPFPLFSAVGVEIKQALGTAALFYRAVEWERGFLEVGAGARVVGIDNVVNLASDPEGIAAFSAAASENIASMVATQAQTEVRRRLGSVPPPVVPPGTVDRIACEVEESVDPAPPSRLTRAATDGLNNPIRDKIKEEIFDRIVDAGPIRNRIKELAKARVEEQIAILRDGARSRAAARAQKASEKAEKKLAREIERQVTESVPDQVAGDAVWVDPILAVRARHNLTENLYAMAYADIGGFGVSSELTWQAGAGIGWRVNNWLAFEAAYRHLSIDYQRSVVFDVEMNGLFLGAAITF